MPCDFQSGRLYRTTEISRSEIGMSDIGLRGDGVQPAQHLIAQHRLIILKTVARALNAHECARGTGGHRLLQPLADVLLDEFVGRALNDENRILEIGRASCREREWSAV